MQFFSLWAAVVLSRIPLVVSDYKIPEKRQALRREIQDLLDKEAIEPVQNKRSLGFYSRVFLVPKKTGGWRLVTDLSSLNQFVEAPKFKMETPESISASLQQGEWVTSLDLKDVYLHIPIHPRDRKYIHFPLGDKLFQFTAQAFG